MMNDQNNLMNANLSYSDEKPIGVKNKFCIPQYAQNEQPAIILEHQAAQKLPLIKRIQSKALKTKKQAVEQLFSLVKDNIHEYRQYQQFTNELISFTNISIVQMSLKILLMYLNGGQQLKIDQKSVIKTIIEKCLASEKGDKQQIRKLCEEILFYFMDHKFEDLLINELNQELLNKNPKIMGITLLFIAKLLNNYGIKRLKSLEKFYKNLEFLSIPPKPLSKTQTIQFYKQVYRWMGDNTLKQFKIHAQIKQEIFKFAKEYVKMPMEIKRGFKKEQMNDGKKIYQMDIQSDQNQQEVDVLGIYTSRWVDQVLGIQKWKDKKATLQEFIKKTKVNNILPHRDLSHFITLIKRLLAQNNINLLQCGFLVTQNLAKGLKKHFYLVAKNIVPYVFSKLKDSKPAIVEMAHQTLKSILWTLTIEDIIDDIKDCMEDKAYLMRIHILKFLNIFTPKKEIKVMNTMRSLLDKIVRLTEDGNEIVRKQSLQLLCSLKKYHEMKYFGDKLKKIDSKKMAIIQNTKGQEHTQMELQNIPLHQYHTVLQHSHEKKSFDSYQIQEHERKSPQKYLKKAKSLNNKLKVQDLSAHSSAQSKTIKSVNSKTLNDLSSHNQAVRYLAYQQISTKCSHQQLKYLMFNIKSTAIRQSSPNLLKIVLALVSKYCGNDPVDLQTLTFLEKHDWKKSKHLLSEFLSNHKLTTEANDHAKLTNILLTTNKSSILQNNFINQYTLKNFMKQLEFLLTKMTNPIIQIRIQAAQHAIKLLQSLQPIQNEAELTPNNGYNQDCINKFCGMVRFRLNESQQTATIYCELLKQMIIKGILTKNKGLKIILQTILSRLKQRKDYIKNVFEEIANTNSLFLFSVILGELVKQVNEPLIEFIIENNELFIRNAELKAYICPFLNLLFNSDMRIQLKQNLEKLLDQIVQLSGEQVLEAEFKKIKLKNAEQYLAKFNISVKSPGSNTTKNVNIKSDRLKMDEENPWPIFATPNHILKLINVLISLKEPLPTLATPLPLNPSCVELLYQCDHNLLAQYSDILLKWVYWRVIIDPHQMMPHLVKFASNIILAVNVFLSEVQFTMLLSIMINIMTRFKADYHKYIGQLLSCIYNIDNLYKERSLSFWVNFITSEQSNNKLPVDEILKVIMSYSADTITQHLPGLARSPQVVKNQSFLRFISLNFDHQFLTVSGFRVINPQKAGIMQTQLKPLLSQLGGPQNVIKIQVQQKRYYITQFVKLTSIELQNFIGQINKNADLSNIIDTHMKILYSIVVPFMKKQISVINVYSYFRQLLKLINCTHENLKFSHCLKDLTRMLMYFLIDLDENTIQNKEEITKSINKIILLLLEQSQSRHMLEVLFLLLKSQLNLGINCNSKLQNLIYKCIGKVLKSHKFLDKWSQNLLFIITETNNLISAYDLKLDCPLIKAIKNTWKNDMLNNPSYACLLGKTLNQQNTHQILKFLFQDLLTSTAIGSEINEKENQSIKVMGAVGINKLMNEKKNQPS